MNLPKKVLVLGSGAIKIGEAGEFDYSGSQCLKALKEEGIKTVLVNPNIATIQTSPDLADKIYFLPVTPYFVLQVIKKENPDSILLAFGGQTALNCGLQLAKEKVFEKFKVRVLGTPVEAIISTEDRKLFVNCLKKAALLTPKSIAVNNLNEAASAVKKIGFPAILRVGFALGGLGSKPVFNLKEFKEAMSKSLSVSRQVLIEEYLGGWKEIEYEVVRDRNDNCLTVCNMENFDPMGIHTGESIVVAPSQTLTDFEYQELRRLAIKLIRHLGIVGECNIQFALNPKHFDYRIIEVNARLSRSSALASKATGYPLAFIAAKLALGYSLFDLENKITKKTKAFFEPALDYLALKFPRWDLEKFTQVGEALGTEMKSVGEVMALARSFPAALQKAIRMLNIGQNGLMDSFYRDFCGKTLRELEKELIQATPKRIFAIAAAITQGLKIETISNLTGINPWFLQQVRNVVDFDSQISTDPQMIKKAKLYGFSDEYLGQKLGQKETEIRKIRQDNQILPVVKQIDTVAAEFPAQTNYLYLSYSEKEHDIGFTKKAEKKAVILGSGPYCIGSSVEFDWCAVNAAWSLSKHGWQTIMVNCNPETVSTDFDIGNKLYFEELSFEKVADICALEKPEAIILSFGGQIPNNLAYKLNRLKIPILGTAACYIDQAEDRHKFSKLLDKLQIKQPEWQSFSVKDQALAYAQKIGFPVLVRPSYVLSGSAMFVAYHEADLEKFLERSLIVSRQYPLVISKFIEKVKEVDVDGVAQNGKLIIQAVSEHVENAGVHSGDATLIFPPQQLPIGVVRNLELTTGKIVEALKITGPFNVQYLVKNGDIMVIECNLRASRSFPFVSKVSKINFVELAVCAMLGKKVKRYAEIKLPWLGVKSPQFSFTRLRGADPVLRVEMASTGEIAALGEDFYDAYLKSVLAGGMVLPKSSLLLSIGGEENKYLFLESAKMLGKKFRLFASPGTADFLRRNGVKAIKAYKSSDFRKPQIFNLIEDKKIDLVINISRSKDFTLNNKLLSREGYLIRRKTVDFNIPLITNLQNAITFTKAINAKKISDLEIKSWDEYKL